MNLSCVSRLDLLPIVVLKPLRPAHTLRDNVEHGNLGFVVICEFVNVNTLHCGPNEAVQNGDIAN